MSRFRINIERINVSLHGVSAGVVEQASESLEAELKRRLGTIRVSQRGAADPGFLNLGPIHIEPSADGATLRSLVAERLTAALQRQLDADEDNEVLGP